MTPLFFIFSTLCVFYGGEDNCDYQYVYVHDRQLFEETYIMYEGTLNPSNVGDFTVRSEGKVFLSVGDISHEVEHILCKLKYSNLEQVDYCDKRLDMYDVAGKSRQ